MNRDQNIENTARTRAIGVRSVSAIAYGAASLSFDSRVDMNAQKRALREAVDSGMTLIDTARAYTTVDEDRHNERMIGRVLGAEIATGAVMIATKGGHYRRGDDFPVDGSPAALKADCEGSLRSLGVDVLDLYFIHKPDSRVPFEDSVGALADLQRDGLIRSVGVSNISPSELAVASSITRIDAVENHFDPHRPDEVEMLSATRAARIAYLSYSPLAMLTERAQIFSSPEMLRIAATHSVTMHQLVLAWTISRGPNVIAITGATRVESIRSSAQASALELSESENRALTDAFSAAPKDPELLTK